MNEEMIGLQMFLNAWLVSQSDQLTFKPLMRVTTENVIHCSSVVNHYVGEPEDYHLTSITTLLSYLQNTSKVTDLKYESLSSCWSVIWI